jgi:hypothetical protein
MKGDLFCFELVSCNKKWLSGAKERTNRYGMVAQ